jgi:hypothetical protein
MIQWKELTYQTIKCSLKKKKGGNIKSFDIFDIDRYIYIFPPSLFSLLKSLIVLVSLARHPAMAIPLLNWDRSDEISGHRETSNHPTREKLNAFTGLV